MTQNQELELDAGINGTQLLPQAQGISWDRSLDQAQPEPTNSRPTRTMARTLIPAISGLVAILTTLATTTVVIIFAVTFTIERRRTCILALAAAIIQVVSWSTLVYMLLCHLRQRRRFGGPSSYQTGKGRHSLIFALAMLPSLLAGVAVGALLGWTNTSRTDAPSFILGLSISTYLFFSFILWGTSVIAQILFFTSLAWAITPYAKSIPEPLIDAQDTRPEMVEPSRPTTSTTTQSNPFREPTTSHSSSAMASEGTSSLRSSLSIKTKSISTKNKFLSRQQAFQSRSSLDSPAKHIKNQDEGFDSWDTSAVGPHIRETVLQSSPSMKPSGLEPIPGSRSPSPAKALEGPFFDQGPSESPPPSPLPQPTISRPGSRQRSASSEDHIHPLFRTCSPAPPPTASSGTVVTAAPPSASQYVNQHILKRMRSGSLPSSPSPLVRSESFSDFMASRTPTSPRSPRSPSQETLRPLTSSREDVRPLMPGRFPSAVSGVSQVSQETMTTTPLQHTASAG
ncbi:MAG: hypothetical protein Q9190_002829 [Brigantiaea leucoxantha]